MNERISERNGEKVVEVRSDGGKLLFVKTKLGYELKCPRTKQICLVKYEEMIADCLECLSQGKNQNILTGLREHMSKRP